MIKEDSLYKIVFKQMPLELETEMFFDFLESNWSSMIINKYPGFLKIKNIKFKKKKLEAIKNEISKIRTEFGEKMGDALETIKKDWKKVERKVFQTLSEIIQEDWLKREITAYISLNPICPRYLDNWSFSVTFDRKNLNKIIAHEISHFLFFKKFKEVFPDIGRENYEQPHKEWLLSELVAVIVLNESRISEIIGTGDNDFYTVHKKLKAGDKFLTDVIGDLYTEFVIEKKDFSKFVKNSIEILKDLK